jgi:hypothetical protein
MARRADKVAGDVQAERAILQCGLPQHMGKVRGMTMMVASSARLPAFNFFSFRNFVPFSPRFLPIFWFLSSGMISKYVGRVLGRMVPYYFYFSPLMRRVV